MPWRTHLPADLPIVETYYKSAGVTPTFKEALLLPGLPDQVENVRFWETACLNRGLRVRIFKDLQSALAWLLP